MENIKEIVIGNSIAVIGDYSFVGCVNLANVKFSEKIKIIGESAFSCCGITSLTIPNSIELIKQNAFSSCFNLENINIPDIAVQICAFTFDDTKYYNDEKNWNDNVLYIGKHLIKAKDNISENYIIVDETKTIADNAFHECSNLVNVTIPDSVVLIGRDAFLYTSKLKSIVVYEGNSHYSNDEYGVLFNKEKTELIHYPTGNKRTEYVIPNDVIIIHSSAFAGSDNLLDITIPNSVTQIHEAAFNACKLIRRFDIPNSVTTIGNAAFSGCATLEEITLSNSLTRIEGSTFNGSENLKSVTIPKSVKVIDYYAFFCTNIKDVYFCGSKESWNSISVFPGNEPLLTSIVHYNYCPHNYKSVVTAPTCTSEGYTTYTCHCGDTYTGDYVDALSHNYKDGICTDCEAPDPLYFTFEIQQPSRTTIRCNDGIKLHTKIIGNLSDGSRIEWSKNNNNFNMTTSASGNEITIISKNNGYTTFTATVYDADNNVIAQDTIEMYSKAGLFDKIGSFFRSLFGGTKIYEN